MRKNKILLLIFPILIIAAMFLASGKVNGQSSLVSNDLKMELPGGNNWGNPFQANESVSCFDYYKFQSIQTSISADKNSYNPGEKIIFGGKLINDNEYPVFDGYVLARVVRNGKTVTDFFVPYEGNYVIDEFMPLEKVAIDAKGEKPVNFEWILPDNLIAGKYQIYFYFSVGKKFNLGGLPFTNDISASIINFSINSQNQGAIYFRNDNTRINGQVYNYVGSWPNVNPGEKAEIHQFIKNDYSQTKKVDVSYDLYYWDSLNNQDRIDTKKETIEIPANSEKDLLYTIPQVLEPVYSVKITATNGNEKSIVNLRIASNQEKPRLNFPGLNKFPLKKGESATLFSCFHNTSGLDTRGKMLVTLTDKNNKEVAKIDYSGDISSLMAADKKEFTAGGDFDYLKIRADIYNKDNKLVDSYEAEYDCRLLESKACSEMSAGKKQSGKESGNTSKTIMYLIFGVITIILILGIILKGRSKLSKGFSLILVILSGSILLNSNANADSVSTAENFIHHFAYDPSAGNVRQVASGWVSATFNIDPSRTLTDLQPTNAFSFNYYPTSGSPSGLGNPTFGVTGGNWDTPYGFWTSDYGDDSNIETDPPYLSNYWMTHVGSTYTQYWTDGGNVSGYVTFVCQKPNVSYSSNNAAVTSCAGSNCTANAVGNATITANIGATACRIYSFISYGGTYGIGRASDYPTYNPGTMCNNSLLTSDVKNIMCCWPNAWEGQLMWFWPSDQVAVYNWEKWWNISGDCDDRNIGRHGMSSLVTSGSYVSGTYKINLPSKTIDFPVTVINPNPNPVGWQDGVDNNSCSVNGWAYDPSVPAQSIDIHYYEGDAYAGGTYLGQSNANIVDNSLNAVLNNPANGYPAAGSISGGHRFNYAFTYPGSMSGLWDGNPHNIYSHPINVPAGNNFAVGATNRVLQCGGRINVAVNGSGMVTGGPSISCGTSTPNVCAGVSDMGTGIALVAAPVDTNNSDTIIPTFNSWGGSCSGGNTTCNLMVDSNEAITANFGSINCIIDSWHCNTTARSCSSLPCGSNAVGSATCIGTSTIAGCGSFSQVRPISECESHGVSCSAPTDQCPPCVEGWREVQP